MPTKKSATLPTALARGAATTGSRTAAAPSRERGSRANPGGAGPRSARRKRGDPVAPPAALELALARRPDAWANWEKLAPSHRKEYVQWITSAKRVETAERRVALALEKLAAGTKTPMRANDAPAVSTAPLARKLGIKPDTRLVVVASPGTPRPTIDGSVSRGKGDLVLVFARDANDLSRIAPRAYEALAHDGALWIAYRKKTRGTEPDLSRDRGWDVLTRDGWQAVSLIAIDSIWSALRFKKG